MEKEKSVFFKFAFLKNFIAKIFIILLIIYMGIIPNVTTQLASETTFQQNKPASSKKGDDIKPDFNEIKNNVDSGEASLKKGQKNTVKANPSSNSLMNGVYTITNMISGILKTLKASNVDMFGQNPKSEIYKLAKQNESKIKGIEIFENKKILMDSIKHENTLDKIIFRELKYFDIDFFNTRSKNTNTIFKGIQKALPFEYLKSMSFSIIIVFMIMLYGLIKLIYNQMAQSPKGIADTKIFLQKVIQSIGIMFIIPIILVFLCTLNDVLCNILLNVRKAFIKNGVIPYEYFTLASIYTRPNVTGFKLVFYAINFQILTVYLIRYMRMYRIRLFTIIQLITVAPFVVAQNARSASLNNKSTIFTNYIFTLSSAIFLEPIYMLLYLIFIYGLNEIFIVTPVFSFLVLFMFPRLEKTIKNIFGLRNQITIRSSSEQGLLL